MSEENKIRLVALIEEVEKREDTSLKKEIEKKELEREYKVINFLPDIRVEKIVEEDVHIQDKNNKYCFSIEKKEIFRVPYTKKFKDLTVIVGENGAGKTMMLNKIFKFGGIGFTYLIFEKNKEILIYRDNSLDNIALYHSNDYTHHFRALNTEKYLNIIKFSNAIELQNIGYYTRSYEVDASVNEEITSRSDSVNTINKENKGLWGIEDQIIFVNEFKGKIRKFVDYTKKGITVYFEGERLPFRSEHLDFIDGVNNDFINGILVDYYSILINYIIDIDYNNLNLQKIENLLDIHLSLLKNPSNIILQYKSIGVDKDRFLPNEYSRIDELLQDEQNKESDDCNNTFLIAICHSLFIIDLYFKFKGLDKKEDNEYKYRIENNFKKLVSAFQKSEEFAKSSKKFKFNFKEIEVLCKKLDDEKWNDFWKKLDGEKWNYFWEEIEEPCMRVAKGVYYTSFFKLDEDDCCVKYKLIPEKVLARLREYGVHEDEVNCFKKIDDLLSKLDEINMDFEILTSLIENISKLENINLNQFLKIEWKGLSSGELALLKTFSRLYSAKKALERKESVVENKENYLLLLDEVDLGLHPRWQRKWISTALPIIEKIFEDNHLQIIITTHSPIFLSDIFEENIIFLPEESGTRNYRTFGQNIYSLFKNAFFLNEDEFIGEYAYQKIQDTIEYLRFKIDGKLENLGDESLYSNLNEEDAKNIAKKIIDSIGEKIISNQLYELFDKAFPPVKTEIKDIENRIKKLKNRLRELRGGEN